MIDHFPQEYDAQDDYASLCITAAMPVATARAGGQDSLGIVLGGSGNGEQMAANKVPGIRAALAWNVSTAQLAREHNNAQVVAVGGRQHEPAEALEIIAAFLNAKWSGEIRHARRIGQIEAYETTGKIAGVQLGSEGIAKP